jgi:hypothetical protein
MLVVFIKLGFCGIRIYTIGIGRPVQMIPFGKMIDNILWIGIKGETLFNRVSVRISKGQCIISKWVFIMGRVSPSNDSRGDISPQLELFWKKI